MGRRKDEGRNTKNERLWSLSERVVFPKLHLLFLRKQADSLACREILEPQGEYLGAAEGHKPDFSLYCLFQRISFFSLCSCRELLGAVAS